MLLQLPNGDWVNPEEVIAIAAYDIVESANKIIAPNLLIHLSNGEPIFHFYNTFAEAVAMRDEIGNSIYNRMSRRLPDVSARPV